MSMYGTKRKMFTIATGIFVVTMSTVLFLVNEDKLDIDHHEGQASVLQLEIDDIPKSENFYRKLVDNEQDDIIVLNDDTSVALASQKLAQTLGYSEAEVKSSNFFNMIHEDDLTQVSNIFLEDKDEDFGPVRIKSSDGSYIPYVISLKSFKNEEGKKSSTVLTLKNTSQAIGDKYEQPVYKKPEVIEPEVIEPEVNESDVEEFDIEKADVEGSVVEEKPEIKEPEKNTNNSNKNNEKILEKQEEISNNKQTESQRDDERNRSLRKTGSSRNDTRVADNDSRSSSRETRETRNTKARNNK